MSFNPSWNYWVIACGDLRTHVDRKVADTLTVEIEHGHKVLKFVDIYGSTNRIFPNGQAIWIWEVTPESQERSTLEEEFFERERKQHKAWED